MPELPEVETVCNGLQNNVIGLNIDNIIIRRNKLREYIPDNIIESIGTTITNVFRRAKYIIIELSNNKQIIIHLGMSGTFTIKNKKDEIKKHSHFELILSNGLILRYNDPRRFGMILFENNYLENKYIKKCGIEPLTSEFMNDYLFNKSRNKRIPIKPFLMKNEIVVGIGNIYASETLFASKINPTIFVKDINKEQFLSISTNAQNILNKSIENGGTTLKDHRTGFDEKGENQNYLNVYGQKTCKTCNSKIEKIIQAQRTTYYCKKCQPKEIF